MAIIILLIITGIFLLILEFFVLPGITIAALGGLAMIGGGIYMAYANYGPQTGHIALFVTLLVVAITFVLALRSKTWKRFMLKTEIDGNIQTVDENNLNVGDKGVAITRLNPVGKVRVNDEEIEGRFPGGFLDPGTEVEVVKVYKTHIIVKPLN